MGDKHLKQHGGGDRWFEAIDASADGMAILDDGDYVYVNEAYVDIHGHDGPDAFLGKGLCAAYTGQEVERLEEDILPAVRENGEWCGEVTGLRSDGTEFPQEISVSLMEDGGFVCVARDITDTKERERQLERYEAFVESSPDAIVHLGDDGTVLYTSPTVEDVLGYGREEMVGDNAFEYVHPDDRETVKDIFVSAVNGEDTGEENAEFRARHADGEYVWVENAGADARYREYQTDEGIVLSLRDITDRKEREKELERYEAFVENSSDSITHISEDGEILYRNPSSERVEDEPGEMEGTDAFEHIHPEDRERATEKFFSLLSDPDKETETVEYRSERADGTYEWVEAVATDQRDTEVGGVVVNTRVIDDRKEREKELKRYETFVENSSDIVSHIGEDGKVMYYSPSAERILGHGPEERIGDNAFDYIHPDDRGRLMELAEYITEEEVERAEAEFRARDGDGEYLWLEAVGTDQRDTDVGGFVVNVRDITERKEREKELERYEAFIESSTDIITQLDEDGTILYQSPSIERILGYGQDETVGDEVFEYVHPDDREGVLDMFYAEVDDIDREVEFRLQKADGDYVWVEATGSDHTDTEAGGFIVNTREITERKRREKQLERHEAFVENSSDLIVHLDEDGTLLYESPGTQDIFGHEPGINLDENVFKYVHPDDRERVLNKFNEGLEQSRRTVESIEFRMQDADGDYVWLEAVGTDQRDTELGGVIVSLRDISDRKEREKELERYEAFVENSSDVIIHVAEDGTSLYHSPGTAGILSGDPDEMDAENIFERVHPDDKERVIENFTSLLDESDKKVEDVEFRVRRDDGEYVWVEAAGADQTHTEFGGAVVSLRDISDRVERRKELERYEAFVKSTSDVVTHIDENGKVVYTSPSIQDAFGYEQDELVGDNAFEYIHPDDREKMVELFEATVGEDGDPGEENTGFRVRDSEGDYVWVEDAAGNPAETGLSGVVLNLRDVTERKKREKELERYEAFLENSLDIFSVLDEGGRYIYNSPSVERILGYDPEDYTGEYSLDYVHPDDRKKTIEWFYSLVEGDAVIKETELRYRDADGNYLWFEVIGTDQRDTEVGGIVFNARDITERKKRERELREEQQAMETVLSNVPVVVFTLDEDGVFTRSQGKALEKIGLEPGEAVGESVFEIYDDRPDIKEDMEKVLSGERVRTTVENSGRIFESWYEPLEDEEGEMSGVVGMAYDVTEREEREQELERYEAFIEHSSDVVTLVEGDGTILYFSPSVEYHAGHSPEEREGENIYDYVHPEDKERVIDTFSRLLKQPETQMIEAEFRYRRDDGSYIWVEARGTDQLDTELGGIVVNSRDITERKKSEERLERSRELLRHTERIADTGGWEYEVEDDELRWTEGAYDIHGVPQDFELATENIATLYHPEDSEELGSLIRRCIKEGEPYEEVFRITETGDDREMRWVRTNGVPITEDGEVVKIRGAIQDITEQKEREGELRRSRELLGQTERIADTGGWELDAETDELRWTDGTRKIHDVSMDYDPTVEDAIDFYHPEDRDKVTEAVERCREEAEPYDEEIRLVTPEDDMKWVRTLGEPVSEDGEVIKLRGAIQDITERKEREREIKEQKDQIDFFNSLLRHDMLNSMTVIGGSSDLLLEELPEDDEMYEHAERISKHSTEIVELTERVRSVLRRLTEEGETEMSPAELDDVVNERVESLKETYPEVTCTAEASDEVRVAADPFLNHVLDNVLINAVEHNDKDEPRIDVTVEDGDETATVRIADNGPGVPDEEKGKVFKQGTTGRTSGSVGFGLYYVEQMVSEYGGDIYVEDNEPEGAVFVMELPKAGNELTEAETLKGGD